MRLLSKIIKILPKNLKPVIVGVPVIIQNSKKEILLGKRSRTIPFYPNTWGLPGGLANQGETLIKTAIREVKEELEIKIKIIKQSKIIHECFATKKSPFQAVNIIFYAKIIKGIPKPKDETKEVRWFSPKEIRKMKLAYTHKDILKKEGLI